MGRNRGKARFEEAIRTESAILLLLPFIACPLLLSRVFKVTALLYELGSRAIFSAARERTPTTKLSYVHSFELGAWPHAGTEQRQPRKKKPASFLLIFRLLCPPLFSFAASRGRYFISGGGEGVAGGL